MLTSEIQLRVRYGETDRMNYVYYGHYAAYFEVARVEALRQIGLTYREMEDKGILLPVYSYQVRFRKPAGYDELLTIRTTIPAPPTASITFQYETFNEQRLLLNTAEVVLVFISKQTGKPMRAPEFIREKFNKYFS